MTEKIKCKTPDSFRSKLSKQAAILERRINRILDKVKGQKFSAEIALQIMHGLESELLCRQELPRCDVCPSLQSFCPSCGTVAAHALCLVCGTPTSFGCSWRSEPGSFAGFKTKEDFRAWINYNCRNCSHWNNCSLFLRVRNDYQYKLITSVLTVTDWKVAFVDGGGSCCKKSSQQGATDWSLRMSRQGEQ